MPVLKIWCLPAGQTEEKLNALHKAIVKAIVSISELGLKTEKDITCLFVPDLMAYGLGEEIIIEIDGLFDKPERTEDVKQRLAESVGKSVKELYPNAKVECFVRTFNPKQGFWTSN